MKRSTISFILEILSTVGIMASIIYLALEIRQNSKISRAEMTTNLMLASRTAILDIAANDNLSRLWSDIGEFENEELSRKHAFYQSFFRLYELQHSLDKQGLLEENIAESYILIIRMFAQTKDFPDYWQRAQYEFNSEFTEFVNEQIAIVKKQ